MKNYKPITLLEEVVLVCPFVLIFFITRKWVLIKLLAPVLKGQATNLVLKVYSPMLLSAPETLAQVKPNSLTSAPTLALDRSFTAVTSESRPPVK